MFISFNRSGVVVRNRWKKVLRRPKLRRGAAFGPIREPDLKCVISVRTPTTCGKKLSFLPSATMITDILLVLAPILILRSTRLDPRLHRRLVAAVSISVLATVFSVIHIVLVLTVSGLWGGLSALVEVGTHQL